MELLPDAIEEKTRVRHWLQEGGWCITRAPRTDARIASIDILRGAVMVLMALDHVRDYFTVARCNPMDLSCTEPALFLTRWITHFCAPVFVFLAGASAGLMSGRKSPAALGRFLLARGAWLIIVEWFVMSTAFTFSLHGLPQLGGRVLIALQVIWAIGASLIVLAGVQFAGKRPALLIGAAILLAHNLLDPIWPVTNPFDTSAPLWAGLHSQIGHVVGPYYVAAIYPLLPWTGVLLLGYGASPLFEGSADARRRRLLRWGLVLTLGFVALRLSGAYGDPNAERYIADTLIKRRDKVSAAYLPTVNPLVGFALGEDGALTFENAAIKADTAAPPSGGYTARWATFDNATGTTQPLGETSAPQTTLASPPGLARTTGTFVQVAVTALDQRYPSWGAPVTVHFKRQPQNWKLVGIERLP